MRIVVDAMSGDKAPLEIIKGFGMAAAEFTSDQFTLVGNESVIKKIAAQEKIDIEKIEIVHTEGIITMEDDPLSIARAKRDSSMAVGLQLLADGKGDVFVSAGNTGALFTGASLIVRKMKGVLRPAIGTLLPFNPPVLLLDSGANLVISEENMEQFAHMGSAYMKKMYGIEAPRVGILNNGEEECKGLELQINSYKRLSDDKDINFVGNIEGNKVMNDACDVLITDGFTGNILLKTVEGMGKMMLKLMKGIFYKNLISKISALMVKKSLGAIKKDFDPSEHGGAPILGVAKPVIKAHGSSNAKAIKSAIRQAIQYVNSGISEDIAADAAAFAEKRKAAKKAESVSDETK